MTKKNGHRNSTSQQYAAAKAAMPGAGELHWGPQKVLARRKADAERMIERVILHRIPEDQRESDWRVKHAINVAKMKLAAMDDTNLPHTKGLVFELTLEGHLRANHRNASMFNEIWVEEIRHRPVEGL